MGKYQYKYPRREGQEAAVLHRHNTRLIGFFKKLFAYITFLKVEIEFTKEKVSTKLQSSPNGNSEGY